MRLNENFKVQLLNDIEECKIALSSKNNKDIFEKMKAKYSILDKDFSKSIPNYAHTIGDCCYNQEIKAVLTILETYSLAGCIPVDEVEIETDKESHKEKKPIIFLSHCSKNKEYADILRQFIINLGVKNNQLIYTSHPLNKIPLDENIYDYLRKQFNNDLFVIELLSEEYFNSPACLNEMGAAWVTKSDYTNVFLPDFDFNSEKYHNCAIDESKMGIVLRPDNNLKVSLYELKEKIAKIFNLVISETEVQYYIEEFFKALETVLNEEDWICQII